MVAASAQPAAPPGSRPANWGSTLGTTWGTAPFANWSAATSPSHFVKKPATSMLKAAGGREGLRVSRPAQALVALRAVRGHVEEVPLLAPDDVALELVDEGLRGLELARPRHVGVDDDAGQGLGRELAREAVHRHVAEPEEGEERLEGLRAAALQRVLQGRLRLAQVLRVEVALLVEDLGVAEGDGRARGALHLEPDPAHHVLAQVGDRVAARSLEDLDRLPLLDPPHRRTGGGDEVVLAVIRDLDACPLRDRRSRARSSPPSRGARRRSRRGRSRTSGGDRSRLSSCRRCRRSPCARPCR